MLKQFIISLIWILFLVGCGSGTVNNIDIKNDKNIEVKSNNKGFDEIGLEHLNRYRNFAGMISFSINKNLTKAAEDHALYQIENNLYTHLEHDKTPFQRVIDSGYTHGDISENIYAGDVSAEDSIDILFSNIYHRLAFLDFGFDEIGFGMGASEDYAFKKVYTYEMGRKNSRLFNTDQNPKIVLWPYEDQEDVMPVFYEEKPDPLPECSVSGYPISIQFNPSKSGKIVLDSFKLYSDSKEIIDAKLLEDDGLLSDKEFVLMPLTRLKWGTTYHVSVIYVEDKGKMETLEWDFTTKRLPEPYFIVNEPDQSFSIKSGETYYFYLPPRDCNDRFETYRYRYTAGLKIQERMVDNNTIKIKATGVGTVKINPDNGRNFILKIN